MKYSLLASGSKGNCCVIESDDTKIVIDCGTTKRYLTTRFNEINYDYHKSDALLITHTHKDHVSQLKMFQDIPTYSSVGVECKHVIRIQPFQDLKIKNICIKVLPLSHDSEGTVGYVLYNQTTKLVYITDTGYISNDIKPYIKNADYYIFESNHDIPTLMKTKRPMIVKQRIINDFGHLCNEDSAKILCSVIGDKTKEIVLAHVSQEGNTKDLAYNTLYSYLEKHHIKKDGLKITVADQFEMVSGGKK